jgi:hypothetical protein
MRGSEYESILDVFERASFLTTCKRRRCLYPNKSDAFVKLLLKWSGIVLMLEKRVASTSARLREWLSIVHRLLEH